MSSESQKGRSPKPDGAIWCGSDAISETDYAVLKHPGVSGFIYALEDPDSIADAVGTIEEHHPDETIWLEAA
ncbi:hypothetical protein [Delftia tsuruhatensis]|uniref:hypothetical protein n=1 Tax=Delftia tsuruhatensis TaxID=180282 RepID=UPI001F2070DD|nr:hypothetical protein [Delftia tsuruhatensis]